MQIRFVVIADVETDAKEEEVATPISQSLIAVLAENLVSDRDDAPESYRITSWNIKPYEHA